MACAKCFAAKDAMQHQYDGGQCDTCGNVYSDMRGDGKTCPNPQCFPIGRVYHHDYVERSTPYGP